MTTKLPTIRERVDVENEAVEVAHQIALAYASIVDGKTTDRVSVQEAARRVLRVAIPTLLVSDRTTLCEVLEGMRKKHREFECNGAHGGKGCYETWCDMETCTSKDALHCKSYNAAIDDMSAFIEETLTEK